MKDKLREITIENDKMKTFTKNVNKNTNNSDIFLFLRKFQDDAKKQNVKITNLGSLYWFLIEHRNKLRAA